MYGAGAASFCLEPEPTQVGRSRSRLRDLGHPEPPKKVAAPQHWSKLSIKLNWLQIFFLLLEKSAWKSTFYTMFHMFHTWKKCGRWGKGKIFLRGPTCDCSTRAGSGRSYHTCHSRTFYPRGTWTFEKLPVPIIKIFFMVSKGFLTSEHGHKVLAGWDRLCHKSDTLQDHHAAANESHKLPGGRMTCHTRRM